jgi:hypothetical protein
MRRRLLKVLLVVAVLVGVLLALSVPGVEPTAAVVVVMVVVACLLLLALMSLFSSAAAGAVCSLTGSQHMP